jgi:hypothetical protein
VGIDIAGVGSVYVLLTRGEIETAAILAGTVGNAINVALVQAPPYNSYFPPALTLLREQLGPAFDAALARGAALDHGQMVDLLLSELARLKLPAAVSDHAR